MRLREAPTVVVIAVVAAGLAVAMLSWRIGAMVVALGLIMGGGLRLGLPPAAAGMLVVRSRVLDAGLLLAAGGGLLLLATSIPESG